MKKLLLIALGVFMLNVFVPTKTNAQISTLNVLKRTGVIVATIEEKQQQIEFMMVDSVSKGSSAGTTYSFTAGNTYGIVAIGDDDRISDIDLEIFDDSGKLVAKDNDDKNVAVASFTPTRTQVHKIRVSPYQMSTQDGFYSIVIFRFKS